MSARYAIINSTVVENVILADATPTIPGRTVVLLASGQQVGPRDSYNGATFTPYMPTAQEQTRAAAPVQLVNAYPTLRQWSIDAQNTYNTANAVPRALTIAEELEFLRRMGILMNRLADLLSYVQLDS